MQPYSQPMFWIPVPANLPEDLTYWFNGVPYPGVKIAATPTGGVTYWFSGLPVPTVFR